MDDDGYSGLHWAAENGNPLVFFYYTVVCIRHKTGLFSGQSLNVKQTNNRMCGTLIDLKYVRFILEGLTYNRFSATVQCHLSA